MFTPFTPFPLIRAQKFSRLVIGTPNLSYFSFCFILLHVHSISHTYHVSTYNIPHDNIRWWQSFHFVTAVIYTKIDITRPVYHFWIMNFIWPRHIFTKYRVVSGYLQNIGLFPDIYKISGCFRVTCCIRKNAANAARHCDLFFDGRCFPCSTG